MNYAMPGWLQPIKNEWMNRNKIINTFDIDAPRVSLTAWFSAIQPRLECKLVKINGPQEYSKRYQAKHLWAIARAHGVTLRLKADAAVDARVSELLAENAQLRHQIARASLPLAIGSLGGLGVGVAEMMSAICVTEPRRAPGVYFLMTEKPQQVVYVGQSADVLFRMQGHFDKAFDMVRMIHVPDPDERSRLERKMIVLFNPIFNRAMSPRHLADPATTKATA